MGIPTAAVARRASVLRTNAESVRAGRGAAAFSVCALSGMRAARRIGREIIHRGHSGLGGYSSEAAVARLKRLDRCIEIDFGPFRPKSIRKIELGVSRAPQKEIRYAL